MARYKYEPGSGRTFGRVDPFCWVAVVPMVLVAAALAFLGGAVPAVVLVCIAGLLVMFDSWANRNAPPRRDRGNFDRDRRDFDRRDLDDGPGHRDAGRRAPPARRRPGR